MRKLKLILGQILGGTVAPLFLTTAGFAMCCFFAPPGRTLPPADNQKTLIVLEDGRQHTIVQPEFNGRLEDFALVMPAPAEPRVAEAPADLFTKLEDYTNPVRDFGFDNFSAGIELSAADSTSNKKVTVLRRDNVGNYTATTIKATDTTELLKWLQDNGYESDDEREEILDYYVSTNGYFVALKVNMSNVSAATTKLDPIDISFPYEGDPKVPTRLLAAMPRTANYIVYVLAPEPYIIPGGDVQFANTVGFSDIVTGDAKPLLGYNGWGQWLVRNKISVDPEKALADTDLVRVSDGGSSVVSTSIVRRNVNPSLHKESSGVVRTDCQSSFFNRSTGRADITNSEDPNDCRFSYSFDLALGNANMKGGFPLLGLLKFSALLVVLGIIAWRAWLVSKHGMSRLLPRPIKATKKSLQWVDHKSGHKVLVKKSNLDARGWGYRHIVKLGLLVSLFIALERSFGFRLKASQEILLIIIAVAILIVGVITLFIRPTVIQVKEGNRALFRYFTSVAIGTGVFVVLWLIVDAVFVT